MKGEKADGIPYMDVEEEEGKPLLIQIALMFTVPHSLRCAVLLGVPKILKDAGPGAQLTVEEIANRIPNTNPSGTSTDPETLDRILRVLATHKLVGESASPSPQYPEIVERKYSFTSFLNCLIENKDGVSLVPLLHLLCEPLFSSNCRELHGAVMDKNATPQEICYGMNIFEWFAKNQELGNLFNKGMGDHSHMWMSKLLESYQGFQGLRSLVDVGGGLGQNLAMILSKTPHLVGISFDLPHVVTNGVQAPRLDHVGGSFFESVPEADAAFMKWILHDWDDESCVKILKNIAKALPPQGKIINVDALLPETTDYSVETRTNLYTDILMMAATAGGKERTMSQFRKLAAEAGFQRVEVITTVENLSVMEFHKT